MVAIAPAELQLPQLEAKIEELRLEEQDTLRRLGAATLEGLPGIHPRRELARVREDLEALYAAVRILEARS